MNKKYLLCLKIITFLAFTNLYSQQDTLQGLLFSEQYKSTLNLSHDHQFEFTESFELKFDLSLDTKKNFGNIFYLGNKDDFYINLSVINYRDNDSSYISLFINQEESPIVFSVKKEKINLREWKSFKIKLDRIKQILEINYRDTTQILDINIPSNLELDLIFGLVPPWKYLAGLNSAHLTLKDVRIKIDNKPTHHFPLNEVVNNFVYDLIGDGRGQQEECEWLRGRHIFWKQIAKFKVDKRPGVTFNPEKNEILIVNESNLLKFNTQTKEIEKINYLKKRPRTANTAIYNNYTNKLFAYYHGQGEVSEYNGISKTWSSIDISKDTLQNYYAHTNFIDPRSGDLYMLGGYGWYRTKNHLQRYNFQNRTWEIIKTSGDHLSPRSDPLITQGFTDYEFFVFGGLGNKSGKQEDGFTPLKDLYLLNIKDYSYKKLWENKDSILALPVSSRNGNFILNKEKRILYGILNNDPNETTQSYNKKLNMIIVDSARIKEMSNSISSKKDLRNFHLILDKKTDELILTANEHDINNDKDFNEMFIFSLAYPPLSYEELLAQQKEKEVKFNELSVNSSFSLWYIIVSSILGIGLTLFYFKKRTKKEIRNITKTNLAKSLSNPITMEKQNNIGTEEIFKSSISLFGEFQVIDNDGNDITTLFSPKNKELFLFILLKTIKLNNGNNHGISTTKLTNTLWPDFPPNEAKNVRGVTIHRLRELLERLEKIDLVFENKSWHLDISSNLFLDYEKYLIFNLKIKDNNYGNEDIKSYLSVVENGGLLPYMSYNWLDAMKQSINEQIIKDTQKLIDKLSSENNGELIIKLADKILSIDQVHEYALTHKINELHTQGHYGSMKETYDSFCKKFRDLYDEAYPKKMDELLKPKNN